MFRALILFLLVSRAMAGDYLYLSILPHEHRETMDSKTIVDCFAYGDREPRAIVLPSMRWQLPGGGPAHLIKEFRELVGGGIKVEKLKDELEQLIDRRGEPLKVPDPSGENRSRPTEIRWSDVYFLIGDDDFITFGETDEGYVVCSRRESGFIARPKKETESE